MVGLLIRFKGHYSNILKKLLNKINFNNFDFDITYFESYESHISAKSDNLSEIENLTSEQAKNRILNFNEKSAAYEFLELFIRPTTSMKEDVDTYGEFLQSDYVMSVIIIDHRNIEICCKNKKWLSIIYNNIRLLCNEIDFKIVQELDNIKNEALLSCFRSKGSINIYDVVNYKIDN